MFRFIKGVIVVTMGAVCFDAVALQNIVTYQGRLASDGTNFTGPGYFKFALINRGVGPEQATALATVVKGFLVSINVTAGGSGYIETPAVTITDATGSGAVAVASVSGGGVSAIRVVDAGNDYSTSPLVTIAAPQAKPVHMTFWSNDGTSTLGDEPQGSLALPVVNGLFMVPLGDTSLEGMRPLTPEIFTNDTVRLRIWFSDGASGFQQLQPDQPITAAPYALAAGTVADGSITPSKLAAETITQLAGPSGSVRISADSSDTNLLAAGYVRSSSAPVSSNWELLLVGPPSLNQLQFHTEVWTGQEVLMWGDDQSSTGFRFNPETRTLLPMSTAGAPSPRRFPLALWSGTEMLIWGGRPSGGRYDPATDEWHPISVVNAPGGFRDGPAVWTGEEMIVWSGLPFNSNTPAQEGGRYDPETDTWRPIRTDGSPPGRYGHVAVWTGTEMIVWGGRQGGSIGSTGGGRYDPVSDEWSQMQSNGPQVGGTESFVPLAFWTGSEMVVYDFFTGIGGRYDPGLDKWSLTPPRRFWEYDHAWFFTPTEFVLILGTTKVIARYLLGENQWLVESDPTIPWGKESVFPAAWTGDALITVPNESALIYRYTPRPPLFLYTKP